MSAELDKQEVERKKVEREAKKRKVQPLWHMSIEFLFGHTQPVRILTCNPILSPNPNLQPESYRATLLLVRILPCSCES